MSGHQSHGIPECQGFQDYYELSNLWEVLENSTSCCWSEIVAMLKLIVGLSRAKVLAL